MESCRDMCKQPVVWGGGGEYKFRSLSLFLSMKWEGQPCKSGIGIFKGA